MSASRHSFAASRGQQGLTLIELMISLLIGAILIGSVLIAVSGTGLSGRKQDGLAQMAEDGQVVLTLLTNPLRMTGFFEPASGVPSLHPPEPTLFGCRNGFTNVASTFLGLACTAGTGNDSIAVRYDGREPGGLPTDCLGNTAIPNIGATAGWVDNRYYIANSASGNPALWCRGNGGGQPQMLVDNVESLQVRYGVADITPQDLPGAPPKVFEPNTFLGSTIRYVRANQLAAGCDRNAAISASWCSVTAVRVCVVMRTAQRTAEQAGGTPFINCDGATQTIADTRLRRSMVTTVSLRNRMP